MGTDEVCFRLPCHGTAVYGQSYKCYDCIYNSAADSSPPNNGNCENVEDRQVPTITCAKGCETLITVGKDGSGDQFETYSRGCRTFQSRPQGCIILQGNITEHMEGFGEYYSYCESDLRNNDQAQTKYPASSQRSALVPSFISIIIVEVICTLFQ